MIPLSLSVMVSYGVGGAPGAPREPTGGKRALWGALEVGLTDACRAGAVELVSMWGHPDQAEGPAAFADKREPDWRPQEPAER